MKVFLYVQALTIYLLSPLGHAENYQIGVENSNFLPYFTIDSKGQFSGFARDLLDLFAQSENVTFSYVPVSVAELRGDAIGESIDLKFPDNPAWHVPGIDSQSTTYSDGVVGYIDGVMVRYESYGAGRDGLKRLALIAGWTPAEYGEAIHLGHIQRVEGNTLSDLLRGVVRRKADGAYYNIAVALHQIDSGLAGTAAGLLRFDPTLPYSPGEFHLSTRRHPELVKRFNSFLLQHRDEVEALKSKHGIKLGQAELTGLEQWKIDFIQQQRDRGK